MRTWAVLVRISWNQHWFPDQWTRAQRALGPHIRSLGEERDEWTSCPVNVLHQAEPRPLPPSREKATFPSLIAVNTFPRFLIKPRHLLPRTNLSDLWKSITSPCYFFLPDVCDTLVIKEAPSLSQTPPFLISICTGAQP